MEVNKMDGNTRDVTVDTIESLKQIFPEIVTDGKVDLDKLRTILGEEVEDGEERYSFTWPGKRDAIKLAISRNTGTLRPDKENSKDWDTTKNLFIEGDNLEVLRVLQNTYRGKVKMIYIDPPYNTGKDFVYKDNFVDNIQNYKENAGLQGQSNADTSGRYHTNWLNMMYPRLRLAKNLLRDDGVIFISIDDHEEHNLRKICDEIFGEENFLACISNITGANQAGEGVQIQKNLEYVLVYSRKSASETINRVDKVNASFRSLRDAPSPLSTRLDMGYTIYYNPTTKDFKPEFDYDKNKIATNIESEVYTNNKNLIRDGYIPIRPGLRNGFLHRWRWGIETFLERKEEVVVKEGDDGYDVGFIQDGLNPPKNYLNFAGGTAELKALFDGGQPFDYPKNSNFISYLVSIGCRDGIVLDFFAGSSTTAHAVIAQNAEDKGNRRFIMVQLPEVTPEDSEARKAGYNTISEIGRERIRRAGEKIKTDNVDKLKDRETPLDVGFKAFTLDTTNFREWDSNSENIQDSILEALDTFKDGRNADDALYEVLLKYGVDLSEPVEVLTLAGKQVFSLAGNYLLVCLEKKISLETVEEMAKLNPSRVVCYDDGFDGDEVKQNALETLKRAGVEDVRVI